MKIFSRIGFQKSNIKDDTLSGFTVALALVPEAVAFSFVAGISPIVGLYGAFMMGLITAALGGRPGMISGATGALAVVMVSLIKEGSEMHPGTELMGLQYLFATLLLMGMLQILAGIFKLGKFVRMIPHPVMMGFVNGLAVVIFLSQMEMFKIDGSFMRGVSLYKMIGLVAMTVAIMFFLPKFTKKIPAALAAILAVSFLVVLCDIDTQTVGSFIRSGGGSGLEASLPNFQVPLIPFNLDTLSFIFPYALILAAIGLIESLMTLNLVDELTNTHGSGNRECVAQGVANITNGFFGGMGGCAMIGQSIINVNSGGRGRLSGIVAALGLLFFILFGSEYIEQVPIAALVGVMFMVVFGTFAWSTFKVWSKVPRSDVFVIVLVTALTVIFDLAVAVISGVVVSALVFAWENALRIRARKHIDENGVKHYEIFGPLFFGSTQNFISKFEPENDPKKVVISFKESRVMDHSGIEAINKVTAKYLNLGKQLHLERLSPDCRNLIRKAEKIIRVNIKEDPDYFIAVDDYQKELGRFDAKNRR